MSLSCNCDYEYDGEPGQWHYYPCGDEYLIPLDTKKRKRCCSCNELIEIGSLCNKYPRYRYPYSDVEARITCGGDLDDSFNNEPEIPIADHYHCEKCAEIYLNLTDIGYECLLPCENMEDSLKEYHTLSGWKPPTTRMTHGHKAN